MKSKLKSNNLSNKKTKNNNNDLYLNNSDLDNSYHEQDLLKELDEANSENYSFDESDDSCTESNYNCAESNYNCAESDNSYTESDGSLSSDDEEEISDGMVGKMYNNKYYCLKYLGKGTFSKVWLVYDIFNDCFFAMKIQLPEYIDDAAEEINIFNKITYSDNSKLIKLYDSFLVDINGNKCYCLILELLGDCILTLGNKYHELDTYIPDIIIKKIIKDILLGLTELHSSKIIHIDLKQENILFTKIPKYIQKMIDWFMSFKPKEKLNNFILNKIPENYNVFSKVKKKNIKRKLKLFAIKQFMHFFNDKLSDYKDINYCNDIDSLDNLCNELDRKDTLINIDDYSVKIVDFGNSEIENNNMYEQIGLRCYRPPENILNFKYNKKSDIWTLGCICYELYTGEYLFGDILGSNHFKKDINHLLEIISFLGDIPNELIVNNYSKKIFTHIKDIEFDSKNLINFSDLENNYNNSKEIINFIKYLLTIDEMKRPNSKECLDNNFLLIN